MNRSIKYIFLIFLKSHIKLFTIVQCSRVIHTWFSNLFPSSIKVKLFFILNCEISWFSLIPKIRKHIRKENIFIVKLNHLKMFCFFSFDMKSINSESDICINSNSLMNHLVDICVHRRNMLIELLNIFCLWVLQVFASTWISIQYRVILSWVGKSFCQHCPFPGTSSVSSNIFYLLTLNA